MTTSVPVPIETALEGNLTLEKATARPCEGCCAAVEWVVAVVVMLIQHIKLRLSKSQTSQMNTTYYYCRGQGVCEKSLVGKVRSPLQDP